MRDVWLELTDRNQFNDWYPTRGLRVMYGFHPLTKKLEDLRQDTIQDIIFLQPPRIGCGVYTYGTPPSCLRLHKALDERVGTAGHDILNAC